MDYTTGAGPMDVTCTRCGTEYEFETAAISAGGMTVKCTDCGHLFKITRPADGADDADVADGWMVRSASGPARNLETFSDLTRMIRDGEVNPSDEISRTGRAWKRLSDVEELARLFPERPPSARPGPRSRRATPDLGLPSRPAPATTPTREPDGPSSDPPPPGSTSRRPPAEPAPLRSRRDTPRERPRERPRQHTPLVSSSVAPEPGAASTPSRAPAPAPAAAPAAPPAPTPAATAGLPSAPPDPEDSATTGRLQPQPADDELGHAEGLARRTGQPFRWLAILLPLGFAAWAGWGFFEEAQTGEQPTEPARELVTRATEALDSHRPQRFDAAIAGFEQALALHPDDPHLLSALSRVYAVWSQDLRFQQLDQPDSPERARWEAEAKSLAAQAKAHAERAAQRNPGHEQAGVALSDGLRLTGNLVGARAELDRARANEGVPEAETLRVAALLSIDEARGRASAGLALAEQAVAQHPALIRARELLARCLISSGDTEGARLHMDAIASKDATHPVLTRLEAALRRPQAPTPSDAAEPVLPPVAAAEPSEPADRGAGAARRKAAPKPSSEPASSVEELVRRGEEALERGSASQAAAAFRKVLASDPNNARARTGLGYVALERGQPQQAIRRFKPATAQGHPEAFIGLGDAYRRLGRAREALQAYERYMRRFPSGSARSIARRQIELLEEQLAEASSMTGAQRGTGDTP